MPHPIVISASRRTDIPAFYMPWFMASVEAGYFEVHNPYNQRISRVPAVIEQVHSIVFWSKNFGPFLDQGFGRALTRRGYRLFFNFTINPENDILEPKMPPLAQRQDQMKRLADTFGPECIQWRLDPICFYKVHSGIPTDNLHQVGVIARRVAESGVRVCITSFVDLYRKVLRRIDRRGGLKLIEPSMSQKVATITRLADGLSELGIGLRLCCEKDLLGELPSGLSVSSGACIPNERLAALFGSGISMARDSGQRVNAGCTCGISKDIGSYKLHPCPHDCLFCYANPKCDTIK